MLLSLVARIVAIVLRVLGDTLSGELSIVAGYRESGQDLLSPFLQTTLEWFSG